MLRVQRVIRSIPHGGHIQLFLVPVLHNWCNKGGFMYYPICGMVHIKDLLLIKRITHLVVAVDSSLAI